MTYPDVFLAGACGASAWRRDIAIPRLRVAGITFYNPQYPEGMWHEGLMAVEREAKQQARWIIDVISGDTRGTASVMEATELVCTGKQVVLVIEDVQDGTVVLGVPITDRDLKDTNRCRAYLREMIKYHGGVRRYPNARVVSTVEEAVQFVIDRMENAHQDSGTP